MVELCDKIPLVQYLKEEKEPQGQSLSDVIEHATPEVKGVFSGSQCLWLISDYLRGVCGCMPASHVVDVDVQIWEYLEAGDVNSARRVHRDKIVLENILHTQTGLGTCRHRFTGIQAYNFFDFPLDAIRVRLWQIHFIEYRQDFQALLDRCVAIGY